MAWWRARSRRASRTSVGGLHADVAGRAARIQGLRGPTRPLRGSCATDPRFSRRSDSRVRETACSHAFEEARLVRGLSTVRLFVLVAKQRDNHRKCPVLSVKQSRITRPHWRLGHDPQFDVVPAAGPRLYFHHALPFIRQCRLLRLPVVLVLAACFVLATSSASQRKQCMAMGSACHSMADMQPIPPPEQLPVP